MANSPDEKTEMAHARLSRAEKDTLDRLVKRRADALLPQGITGQDTFSAYLRAHIRTEAAAHGIPVEETPNEPATPAPSKAQKAGKAPRKPK